VARKTFTVEFERIDDGWWLARVKEIEGCLTQGRTIEQARERIREALEVSLDDPRKARGARFRERFPPKLTRMVGRARGARARAHRAKRQAQVELRTVVHELKQMGVSMRDAAELLGISHQRVQQLG